MPSFEDHLFTPLLSISLPVFEGPLDLLLFLVRKNEVDIYDIPIETITTQYLDTLKEMEKLNLEVAGEFLVMAATLMYIKSRMLLPKPEALYDEDADEPEVDPRWELVQQLLEYKRFKEAGSTLESLIENAQDILPREGRGAEPAEQRPLKPCDRLTFWNTFNRVLQRLTERITPSELEAEKVTIADQMTFVLNTLKQQSSFRFSSLFPERVDSLQHIIATFLALLELARLKTVVLEQSEDFSDILCCRQKVTLETVT